MALRTKERILDAARNLLSVGGPRAVTVQAIAPLVRVTPPALYKHFTSRDAIIEALRSEARRYFEHTLSTAVAAAPGPLERLEASGKAYVDFGIRESQRYRLLFMSHDDDFQNATRDKPPLVGGGLALVRDLVAACQLARCIDPRVDSMEIAIGYWATCHGLVSLYLDAGGAQLYTARSFRALAHRCIGHVLTVRTREPGPSRRK